MRKIKEYSDLGFESQLRENKIAYSCQISRTTVRGCLKRAMLTRSNQFRPSALNEVQVIERLFSASPKGTLTDTPIRAESDTQYIYDQLKTYRKRNLMVTQFWSEYKEAHPDF
jgi:hypothetical protein